MNIPFLTKITTHRQRQQRTAGRAYLNVDAVRAEPKTAKGRRQRYAERSSRIRPPTSTLARLTSPPPPPHPYAPSPHPITLTLGSYNAFYNIAYRTAFAQ